jgi:peptidoglycan/LPS O-acetylase OafA/YrhL
VLGGLLWSLVGMGAVGVILCAIGFGGFENFLNHRSNQFLGRISFSLYLIHVPIVATLAFTLGDAQWWLVGIIGLPLSLAAATLFHRYVEVPSQRLAHRVGARVARPRVAPPAPVIEPVEQAPHVADYPHAALLSHYAAMR